MAKKINPILGIVGGLFTVLLIFSIIIIAFHPGSSTDMNENDTVADGDTVSVYYIGQFENKTVFDSNQGENDKKPLSFVLGKGTVIPGFEKAVRGMKINETKTVTIKPEDAYVYREELVVYSKKEAITEDLGSLPSVGDKLMTVSATGAILEGTVIEITSTDVVIDFNPEVAGKTLVFEIKIVDIQKAETAH
ncbi:MAG: FKBP-type peptidyl-prolyl cis-trans isomerase [Methanimicrococcus sp.]|nr:FKBP-type peptidyl-prolyl cis-trans isomerase [Methanimicrococcus sp.]